MSLNNAWIKQKQNIKTRRVHTHIRKKLGRTHSINKEQWKCVETKLRIQSCKVHLSVSEFERTRFILWNKLIQITINIVLNLHMLMHTRCSIYIFQKCEEFYTSSSSQIFLMKLGFTIRANIFRLPSAWVNWCWRRFIAVSVKNFRPIPRIHMVFDKIISQIDAIIKLLFREKKNVSKP